MLFTSKYQPVKFNKILETIFLLFIFVHFNLQSGGQVTNPHINQLRYNDDFRYLNNDTVQKKGIEHLKMIPLFGNDTNYTISFGAGCRLIYQYYKNEVFNTLPPNLQDADGFLWYRFMLHTDINLGKHLRVFAQLNSALVSGRKGGPRPVSDKNTLALHQAFMDINGGTRVNDFRLRIGRQEMTLINSYLITPREAPNQRLAFDAARFTYTAKKSWEANVSFGQAIDYGFGVFDDKWKKGEYLLSVNIQYGNQKSFFIDFLYVASHKDEIFLAGINGEDERHTIGVTVMVQKKAFNFEAANYYQFGVFSGQKISAYTSFGLVKYRFHDAKFQPFLSLVASAVSGDRNEFDNKQNTFNTLYSRPYYGMSNPLGRMNNNTIEVITGITVPKNIAVKISGKGIWRNSLKDGLYNPGGFVVFPKENFSSTLIPERYVGTSFDWEASLPINQHIAFVLNAEYIIAGPYIKKISNGRNITFFSATLNIAI